MSDNEKNIIDLLNNSFASMRKDLSDFKEEVRKTIDSTLIAVKEANVITTQNSIEIARLEERFKLHKEQILKDIENNHTSATNAHQRLDKVGTEVHQRIDKVSTDVYLTIGKVGAIGAVALTILGIVIKAVNQ